MASADLVKPFRAVRYAASAGPLDQLVAPPYDVITPELREDLLARSRYNAVRLVRPDEPEEAARRWREWRDAGVLVRDERPVVWLLEEEFAGPDGIARTRRALVGRLRLHPYSAGVVLPHERTFPGPKERRLRLLQAVRAKLSPIFLLHSGPPISLTAPRAPDLEATLDGSTSRLWRVDDPAEIAVAVASVRPRLVIADGHHRYETVLRFHEEERREETSYVLAALVSRGDEGLVVFPTHRVVFGAVPVLDGRFRVTPLAGGATEALARLARLPRDRPAFVLLKRDGTVLAEAERPAADPLATLDAAAVDGLALPDVEFTASASDAETAVRAGRAAAALLVRAPTIEQVEAVALAGKRMPPKSTYFFPKLTSGLLFSPFDE